MKHRVRQVSRQGLELAASFEEAARETPRWRWITRRRLRRKAQEWRERSEQFRQEFK